MKIDLHNHSCYSDGVYSCEQLIQEAIKQNVDIFALTDHDSVFGVAEILELNKKYPEITVIPGMELSTYYKGEDVHIVCLFKNGIIPDKMMDFSIKRKEARVERAIKMMEKIAKIYHLKIDLDALFASSDIITRGNMLRNIAACNGLSFEEAAFYISRESEAYIPTSKLETLDGLKLAREANTIAIFAHPCLVKREYIEEILTLNFDGIEVYYPANQSGDDVYFKEMAQRFNIVWSAGSDCHGDETHANIGTSCLTKTEFLPLANKIGFDVEERIWK